MVLFHYLRGTTTSETRRAEILDDILPAQDARIALRGWIAQQPDDVQESARTLICLNRDGSARSVLSGGGGGGGVGDNAQSRRRGKSVPPRRQEKRVNE